jgi:hypothetical protein
MSMVLFTRHKSAFGLRPPKVEQQKHCQERQKFKVSIVKREQGPLSLSCEAQIQSAARRASEPYAQLT